MNNDNNTQHFTLPTNKNLILGLVVCLLTEFFCYSKYSSNLINDKGIQYFCIYVDNVLLCYCLCDCILL